MNSRLLILAGAIVASVLGMATTADGQTTYKNPVVDNSLPDPTVIKADDGHFYLYATENIHNLPIYRSDDLFNWTYLGTAFNDETRPSFVKRGAIWAPDINYFGGRYVLYYAMSTWGGEWECGIGVAVSCRQARGSFHRPWQAVYQ